MGFSRLYADISSNNNHFSAQAYRAHGHILVAIKATEGLHYVNPNHRSWSLHAGMEHVGVVHYHFARPDLNNAPDAEADHFLSTVHHLTGGRDYLMLDLERATPAGWSHDPAWSRGFDAHVKAHSRFYTWLYATRSTLQGSDDWLSDGVRRVVDADWSNTGSFVPRGYELAARQFTDGVSGPEPHELPGVGRCDVNLMSLPIFRQAVSER